VAEHKHGWQSRNQSYITTDILVSPICNPRLIFPILSLIIFLDSFGFVDVLPPLWREVGYVVYNFCRAFASAAFLRSESHGTHEHILLYLFLRLLQLGGPGSCIYFAQEQGSPVIPSGHGWQRSSFQRMFCLSYVVFLNAAYFCWWVRLICNCMNKAIKVAVEYMLYKVITKEMTEIKHVLLSHCVT
jgi:hypothetical protein